MADAKLQAALRLYPERSPLIIRLAGRSCQFRALCADLDDVANHLATVATDADKSEHRRLFIELALELAQWIQADDMSFSKLEGYIAPPRPRS